LPAHITRLASAYGSATLVELCPVSLQHDPGTDGVRGADP
jgi:hypothetical protein